MPDPVIELALQKATSSLAGAEDRPNQRAMAEAVGAAMREPRHLIVQAGTGTGKSLAYLVPILARGARAVISTATKALQDQLATRDLPALQESLGNPFEFAVLKGRSNYICMQKVSEVNGQGDQMVLDHAEDAPPEAAQLGPLGRQIRRLIQWAETETKTGDRAELDFEPTDVAWAQVSVGSRDCPGANRCPAGSRCFAEGARERAGQADVIVVNTHLYATALAIGALGGEYLPPHDVVVFDEAHELEDIASSAFGFEITSGRFAALGRSSRALLDEPAAATAAEDGANVFVDVIHPHIDQALGRPLPEDDSDRIVMLRERLTRLQAELRRSGKGEGGTGGGDGRALRLQQALGHLVDDLDRVNELREDDVAWVEGPEHNPVLRVAPIDVGEWLRNSLWAKQDGPTAVLTSATIPPRLGQRLGLPDGSYDEIDVGSPFAYDEQALLYCPVDLPDPRQPEFEPAMHEELAALIEAAGGRTLALFTSWRAMRAAADVLRSRLPFEILTQSDLPKPALVARFSKEESSCLFATMGFWQGVDVPGSSLSLVTIDKLPFSRPDDPLLRARRAKAGPAAFELIDLPRTAALLAQGSGRLIRTGTDRGVVAVFDHRLAKARYRWTLVNALPPMRRTRHRSDVIDFLASINTPGVPTPSAGTASSGPP